MSRLPVKTSAIVIPEDLVPIFGDPPLLEGERREDWDALFLGIARSVHPKDELDWISINDIAYLCWQIRREKLVELAHVNMVRRDVVEELLKEVASSMPEFEGAKYRIFSASDDAQRWAFDPVERKRIDELLATRGFDQDFIRAKVYFAAASELEDIQRRIESLERRRILLLREIYWRNEAFARMLRAASQDIIEAEFREMEEADDNNAQNRSKPAKRPKEHGSPVAGGKKRKQAKRA